jgi:hypothetical protein
VDDNGIDGPLCPLENVLGRYGSGVTSLGLFNRMHAFRFPNPRECIILTPPARELDAIPE